MTGSAAEKFVARWLGGTLAPVLGLDEIVAAQCSEIALMGRTKSHVFRLELRGLHEGCDVTHRVIAKFPSPDPFMRRLKRELNIAELERKVLTDLQSSTALAIPALHLAIQHEHPGDYLILMEDLGTSHCFQSPEDDVPFESVARIVDAVASWHARWWGKIPAGAATWLPQYNVGTIRDLLIATYETRGAESLERNASIPPRIRKLAQPLARRGQALLDRLCSPPLTVRHGDLHLSNIIVPTNPHGKVGVVDWETACVGQGAADLVGLTIGLLTAHDRRRYEQELLAIYLARLRREGVDAYSAETLRRDYHLGILGWLMRRVVLGLLGRGVPDDSAFQRLMTAIVDLDLDQRMYTLLEA